MRNPVPITESLLISSDREVFDSADTRREPDDDIAQQELAWWLAVQERLEIRSELAACELL
jgi:hypothetical protein